MNKNLDFPKEWFHDEVRDGFYVDGLMKCFWAAYLEVFNEIEAVCDRHGLKIFADCGTLLGAVRHKGFIPWDDDLDFAMLRDDYIKFKKYAAEELPEGYIVTDYHELDNDLLITWVANSRDVNLDEEWLKKYHGFPYPVGIDIFPLDFISPNSEEEDLRKLIAKAVYDSGSAEKDENTTPEDIEEVIRTVEELTGAVIDRNRSLRIQIYELTEQLYSLYGREGAEELALMHYWTKDNSHKYNIHLFDDIIRIPFEKFTLPAPARYDEVLKIEYGDYMRIVRGGAAHDYPAYSTYEKQIAAGIENGRLPYKFYYDEGMELERRSVPVLEADKKRTVLFIPFKASYWKRLDHIWEKEKQSENTDVFVMPIPWFDRLIFSNKNEAHYEADEFPAKLNIIDYRVTDLEAMHPDIIYFQNPCDFYNYTVTMHPDFYSDKLKALTDKLVCVPYPIPDEILSGDGCALKSMEHFVRKPGIINADLVLLPDEGMRSSFIEELVRFAGEEKRSLWERKIQIDPDYEKAEITEDREVTIPDSWIEKKEKKKAVLYYTSLSMMLKNESKMLEKLERTFSTFKKNKDKVILVWHPDPMIDRTISQIRPELWKEYKKTVDDFKTSDLGIYDETSDMTIVSAFADAYYGDPGPEAEKFRYAGKPVMIEDCSI
ncbi:MAG: LicD family protein [Lachnospiraceae bacterium]|nr:LicD family protein [Lachnospiraceae bacterium]